MDQDSSLSTSFDFNSQAGVMSLLASIRASALIPAQKNELRDLVFLYTNGGGDVSVRIALEQKLVSYNIKPVAKTAAAPVAAPAPAVVLPFGSSRPEPSFVAPVVPVAVASAPVAPTPVAPAPVTAAPIPAATVPVLPTPVPTPEPVVAAPVPQPQPVVTAPVPSAPIVASVAPAPVAAPQPQAVPSPVAPVAPVANPNIYLERIREIKSAVNSKVGNPVNLVDINNEVGREYMNALLDAMKRLSGGAAGQIDVAMQRLETAYQAVEVAVADHAKTTAAAVATPVVESVPVVTPTQMPAPSVAPVSAPTPVPTPEPVVAAPVYTPAPSNPSEPHFTPAPPDLPRVAEPAAPITITKPPLNLSVDGGVSGFETTPTPEPAVAPEPTVIVETPVPTPVSAPVVAKSILPDGKALTLEDLPLASTSASGDPLFSKEIDDGLEQLLSDWSLFKKSGLFGTGANGREHPLFKKLAELPIPLLLAGRFEGSTQEIKQSITDYMNGWRYEQGIIYEQGELFEHYLRRVIKQILDLQKKRRNA